jgi:hypothetical protein
VITASSTSARPKTKPITTNRSAHQTAQSA